MNTISLSMPAFGALNLSEALVADLRSDHAGETGAVEIYRGILAVSKDPVTRKFAESHIQAEQKHLAFFESWLPSEHHSKALPLWRLAGWMLGAGSAVFGRHTVFLTVSAVESFVERHYLDQIAQLSGTARFDCLREVLEEFCEEEVDHRDDAHGRLNRHDNWLRRIWVRVVGTGSALGVKIARKF